MFISRVEYPDVAPEQLKTQEVANAYDAACMPDLINPVRQKPAGGVPGSVGRRRPRNDVPVTGTDLGAAIDAVLAGQPVSPQERPGVGCHIKRNRPILQSDDATG